jgi:hypothetical protein
VGVVVLDADKFDALMFKSEFCREIFRMQVVGDNFRIYPE